MADRQRATGNIYMERGGVGGWSCGSGFARYSGAAGGGAGGGGYLRSEMGRGRPAKGNHARNGGSQSQQLAATGRGGLLSSSASLRWLRSENAHFSTSHFLLNYFCFRPAGSCGPQPPAAKARNSRCSCRPPPAIVPPQTDVAHRRRLVAPLSRLHSAPEVPPRGEFCTRECAFGRKNRAVMLRYEIFFVPLRTRKVRDTDYKQVKLNVQWIH